MTDRRPPQVSKRPPNLRPTPGATAPGRPAGGRPAAASGGEGPSGRPPRRTGRPPIIAPLIALIGSLAILAGSLWVISFIGLGTGSTPDNGELAIATPDGSGDLPLPQPTPHATVVITPPPDRTADVKGWIVFTKAGDIYKVTGKSDIRPLTGKGIDSAPTWTPDGKRIVFVETRDKTVDAPYEGKLAKYRFYYPNIMSIDADGGDRTQIYESLFRSGRGYWHSWVLQPAVSPDGKTIAVVTDGKDGLGEVVLGSITASGSRLATYDLPVNEAQGHNDPDWSPDGKTIAFTYDIRSKQIGTPKIGLMTVRNEKLKLLKEGYANPSWSPDGSVIAAERTTGTGRDIVILDPGSGAEIARLTNDGDSFAPAFSPNGDQIAFLRRKGTKVDLWVLTLDPSRGFTRTDLKPVTEDGSLDAESPPSWFIPEDERVPMATPAVTPPPALPSAAPASPGA